MTIHVLWFFGLLIFPAVPPSWRKNPGSHFCCKNEFCTTKIILQLGGMHRKQQGTIVVGRNSPRKEKGQMSQTSNVLNYRYSHNLETPCRKILIQGFFSAKKVTKVTKRWHFRKNGTKQKCNTNGILKESCDVAKLLSGNFRHNSANFWHNSGNFWYKKIAEPQKALYRGMMTVEPLPRSLNLKKDYSPGKKGTSWQKLFFPFVSFFGILWSY